MGVTEGVVWCSLALGGETEDRDRRRGVYSYWDAALTHATFSSASTTRAKSAFMCLFSKAETKRPIKRCLQCIKTRIRSSCPITRANLNQWEGKREGGKTEVMGIASLQTPAGSSASLLDKKQSVLCQGLVQWDMSLLLLSLFNEIMKLLPFFPLLLAALPELTLGQTLGAAEAES